MASSGTTSTRKRFTGAEFIVHFLEQQGIKIVTGIPGGSILPVYDALSQSTQIRHILARHEQGAGFIAQGMARTDGKPAVCMACSGPGATNTVTAIADARLDSIPLICITGQVPASMIGTDAFRGSGHLRHLYPHHQTQLSGQTYRRTPAGHERCLPHCAIRPPVPGVDRHS